MNCRICGDYTCTSEYNKETKLYEPICRECSEKLHQEEIEKKAENVKETSDFKDWDHGHIADLFWIHLAKYKKCPNRKSLDILWRTVMWAHHDSHGLSRNFSHALKWCGIDLYEEQKRKDLPEES